jgi:two-component system, OmpR family, response regulator
MNLTGALLERNNNSYLWGANGVGSGREGMMAYRVLVVDDMQDVRDLLEGVLSLRGYEVITASDGMMAVSHVNKYKPDLMILDVSMPKMSGFQTCQMIRRMPGCNKIPVVFLTAKKSEQDRKFGEKIGGDVYMTKPFNQNELIHEISRLLQERAGQPTQKKPDLDVKDDASWVD